MNSLVAVVDTVIIVKMVGNDLNAQLIHYTSQIPSVGKGMADIDQDRAF